MNFSSSGQMRYRKYVKGPKLIAKLVKKEIHGQMIWVKVYPPRWANAKPIGEMKGGPKAR